MARRAGGGSDKLKKARRRYIGPVGAEVVVTLSDHASNDKFFRRYQRLGITMEQILQVARIPNAGRPDRPDPDDADGLGGKFHRFVKLDGTTKEGIPFLLVCVTEEEASPPLPGRIHIVTLVDQE